MNEDFIWDGSGPPDDETARLETLLRPFGYQGPPTRGRLPRQRKIGWWLGIAAALVASLIGIYRDHTTGLVTSWNLTINGLASAMRTGQTIDTNDTTTATVESEDVGQLRIGPGSRIRLLASGDKRQHFSLDHGTIHALIWAPARQFVVDTPSAKTIDLGCRYSLQMSREGSGLLTVELGWVAFEHHGVQSFIPAGAACATSRENGPGIPYFTDAPAAMVDAVARFAASHRDQDLKMLLNASRDRDALTLWHLLPRTKGAERSQVYRRLSASVQLPGKVTEEAMLRGDPAAINLAWNALGLGNTDWWQNWTRPW